MTALQIVLLVAGIVGFQVVLWIVLLRWLGRATARKIGEVQARLTAAGERALLGPEACVYRGASSGSGFPRTKGNGVAALTEKRLVVRRLVGAPVEVVTAEIAGVRTDKWFERAYAGGKLHVIVKTKTGGELGLFVADTEAWVTALEKLAR